jgi:hypothetical protein
MLSPQCRPRERGDPSVSAISNGPETVIAGAAKQSISPRKERVDCFVAFAPRNDVKSRHGFAISPHVREFLP